MSFSYKNQILNCESVAITDLVELYGSPLYVYSQTKILENYNSFDSSFDNYPHLICYSVKANSNLAVLNSLAKLNAGFDVLSIGELQRVIVAGGDLKKVVFSGVGKNSIEIEKVLKLGIKCINIESIAEFNLITEIAKKLNKIANISFRVNPNIDAKTHPYISTGLKENKFGIDIDEVLKVYLKAKQNPNVNIVGIDCHIGSQITELAPFLDAIDKILILVTKLKNHNINIKHLDLGGGVGVNYNNNKTIDIKTYVKQILLKTKHLNCEIILEPGRAIVANAGIFVTKVEFLKQNENKSFAIVDGAMNDFLRTALYQAYHNILPVNKSNNGILKDWDIVGPICETADYFGKNRKIQLSQGDYLAITDTGAYGFVMSSNYNSRPRVAEVMVSGNKHSLIRKRETIQDLFANENIF